MWGVLWPNGRFLLVVLADIGGAKQVLYQNKLRACTDTSVRRVGGEKSAEESEWTDKHESKLTTETQLGRQVGKRRGIWLLLQLKHYLTQTFQGAHFCVQIVDKPVLEVIGLKKVANFGFCFSVFLGGLGGFWLPQNDLAKFELKSWTFRGQKNRKHTQKKQTNI